MNLSLTKNMLHPACASKCLQEFCDSLQIGKRLGPCDLSGSLWVNLTWHNGISTAFMVSPLLAALNHLPLNRIHANMAPFSMKFPGHPTFRNGDKQPNLTDPTGTFNQNILAWVRILQGPELNFTQIHEILTHLVQGTKKSSQESTCNLANCGTDKYTFKH